MHQRRTRQCLRYGGAQVRKCADAHRSEQCRAVGWPLLAIHVRHGQSEPLRLHSPNEVALRAASGEEQFTWRQPELLEDGERIVEGEAHALEHRAREVGSCMREAQTEEGTTRGRITM